MAWAGTWISSNEKYLHEYMTRVPVISKLLYIITRLPLPKNP